MDPGVPSSTARKPRKKRVAKEVCAAATPTGLQLRLSFSLPRSPSIRRQDSYKGNKHPPRTFTYVPEHLQALGTVIWDADAFECMELSALPWIAAAAQQTSASGELIIGSSADSARVGMFEPLFPDHVFMDEEDVYVRLYAHGPLPASFVDALGRALSVRHEGETGDEEVAANAMDDGAVVEEVREGHSMRLRQYS
ncbi:hypothetical protein OH77DRAFT_1001975 [Trametes cingulata]|nr:hypothetical protein OH77DRAFT_1001975 [Trametes cingulata]